MSLQATTALATLEQAQELGLRPEEFDQIISILGRTPNFTEMSIFSVMWSEHCSYKNSITWLFLTPTPIQRLPMQTSFFRVPDSQRNEQPMSMLPDDCSGPTKQSLLQAIHVTTGKPSRLFCRNLTKTIVHQPRWMLF